MLWENLIYIGAFAAGAVLSFLATYCFYRFFKGAKQKNTTSQDLSFLNGVSDGFLLGELDGDNIKALFINDSMRRTFHLADDQNLFTMNSKCTLCRFLNTRKQQEQFTNAMQNGGDVHFLVNKQGVDGELQYYMTAHFDALRADGDDRPRHCYITFSNVTRQYMELNSKFQKNKLEALARFSAGVAHDFNNILSIVSGFNNILKKQLEDAEFEGSETFLSYLDKISSASGRGSELTRKLQTFSRHKVSQSQVHNLSDIILGNYEAMKMHCGAGIDVDILGRNVERRVECSADKVRHIMTLLLNNAIDAMPSGGNVIIDMSGDPSVLPERLQSQLPAEQQFTDRLFTKLSMTDSGHGMDANTKAKAFDPFFSSRQDGSHTGLGLSIAYGLMQELGGAIEIVSYPMRGCQIDLYFPLSQKELTVAKQSSADGKRMSLQHVKAIVADDEEDLVELISSVLTQAGITVYKAYNGNEALLHLDEQEGEIDLLVTDVVMPELNGIDLAHMVKSLSPQTKVIFMSGYPSQDFEKGNALPDDACFMAKPVDHEVLLDVIADRLSNSNENNKPSGYSVWQSNSSQIRETGS